VLVEDTAVGSGWQTLPSTKFLMFGESDSGGERLGCITSRSIEEITEDPTRTRRQPWLVAWDEAKSVMTFLKALEFCSWENM
jgi:hypothetical protein